MKIKFWVRGTPVPQGSMSAFLVAGRCRVVHQSGAKLKAWRHSVAAHAQSSMQMGAPMDESVGVELQFRFVLPKSRVRKGMLTGKLPIPRMDRKPDVDKLVRAILDALDNGGVFVDDSRVSSVKASKEYVLCESMAGVAVEVFSMGSD